MCAFFFNQLPDLWPRLLLTPNVDLSNLLSPPARQAAGATPIVYMAHPYARLAKTQHADVCAVHMQYEKSVGVAIAPGALAHQMAGTRALQLSAAFSLPLLLKDQEHPTPEGLYLHACCIALALQKQRLKADAAAEVLEKLLPWAPESFEQGKAAFLRLAARDAIAAWSSYRTTGSLQT